MNKEYEFQRQQQKNIQTADKENNDEFNCFFLNNQSVRDDGFSIAILKPEDVSGESDSSQERSIHHQNNKENHNQRRAKTSNEQDLRYNQTMKNLNEDEEILKVNQTTPSSNQKLLSQNDQSSDKDLKQRVPDVYSGLIRYFHVQRFVNKITNMRSMNRKFNSYHFNVINDKAASFNPKLFQKNYENRAKLSFGKIPTIVMKSHPRSKVQPSTYTLYYNKIILFANNLVNKLIRWSELVPIFYPESRNKLFWDGIVLIPRLYFMIAIPLDLAFGQPQIIFEQLQAFTLIMLLTLLINLVISFNTAFYEHGSIVIQRKQIMSHVITKSYGIEIFIELFLLSIYAITSHNIEYFIISASQNFWSLLLLFFVVQYQNIVQFIKQVEETLNLSKQVSSMLELIKLITSIIYVLHVFTCLWYWAGSYSSEKYNVSWLISHDMLNSPFGLKYLYSFYYSAVTMFTVGYGDITPSSDLERVISIIFMMISSIQMSYSLSTVGKIIDDISSYEEEKRLKFQVISTYMQKKKISYQLQYQIREYLNYFWKAQSKEMSSKENQIIESLSEQLRERLVVEANSMVLTNCPLFRNFFSKALKLKLVKLIKQIVIKPENVIDQNSLFPSTSSENSIFIIFIEEGTIEIIVEEDKHVNNNYNPEISVIENYSKGSSLGALNFITGVQTKEKFRTVGFTQLQVLSRQDFLKTLHEFPEDYELFLSLKDQINFSPHQQTIAKLLEIQCHSCWGSHETVKCPLLHFYPDRELIIKQNLFQKEHKRNEFLNSSSPTKFIRKIEIKDEFFNTRVDQEYVRESAINFQQDNSQIVKFYENDEEINKLEQQLHTQEVSVAESVFSVRGKQTQMFQIQSDDQNDEKLKKEYERQNSIPSLVNQEERQSSNPKPFVCTRRRSQKNNNQMNKEQLQVKQEEKIKKPPILPGSYFLEPPLVRKEADQELSPPKLITLKLPPILQMKYHNIQGQSSLEPLEINQQTYPFPHLAPPFFDLSPIIKPRQTPRQKWRMAIRLVQQLNSVKWKQLHPRAKAKILINQINELRKINIPSQLNSLTLRLQYFRKNKDSLKNLYQKDTEMCEFSVIRFRKLMENDKFTDHFENMKKFIYYAPHNNFDDVLYKQRAYYDLNSAIIHDLKQIYDRFVKYMFYPFDYIEKYRFKQFEILNQLKIRSKRGTLQKAVKHSIRLRSILVRKNQVRPLSEGAVLGKDIDFRKKFR